MNIEWVGNEFIELAIDEDDPKYHLVLKFLEANRISTKGLRKLTISILREPLDLEDLHAKSSSTLARASSDAVAQLDAFTDSGEGGEADNPLSPYF